MKPFPVRREPSRIIGFVLIAALLAGCANVLVRKYHLTVDSLTEPGTEKLAAKSYRLVGSKTMFTQPGVQVAAIIHCVNAALSGKGMYEAPSGVASEIFVDVSFGIGASPRGDPSAREVFLQLSGRSNTAKQIEQTSEDEVWNVKVAIDGVNGPMEATMPILATVAADYIGVDTHQETKVDVPQNSPSIEATRKLATQALEKMHEERAAARKLREAVEAPGAAGAK